MLRRPSPVAVLLAAVVLSALCCMVSTQGHMQETIGQTLQGPQQQQISRPGTELRPRHVEASRKTIFLKQLFLCQKLPLYTWRRESRAYELEV